MQQTDPILEHDTTPRRPQLVRRLIIALSILLVVVLLVILPPLISLNRYQHRIASSISQSLGRPVHLDQVTLNLLPLPGFTITNLVVEEDPAFGNEPVIRANTVSATLRISSLWRRRFEFSTISFTDPSVNLVHTKAGKWNLQSILLRASQMQAAPTAQKSAGPAPRFPYIEATGARVNLKFDQEKTPISLTDADFALWLPDPQQWHLRIQAHPTRTDTNVSDTGVLQIEGTLGRAASLGQVPLNLTGTWRNAPLGEASLLVLGHDAGLRGEISVTTNIQGTVTQSAMQLRIRTTDARRADFVPERSLNIDLQCLGTAASFFHAFQDVRCSWPPASSSDAPILAITANLPDVRKPADLALQVSTPGLPAAILLDWLRIASARVPDDITMAGTLTGNLAHHTDPASPTPDWQGALLLTGTSLINPHAGPTSLVTGDVALQTPATPPPTKTRHAKPATTPAPTGFVLAPTSLALGGKDPATLDGHIDSTGYTLHLTGMASIARLQGLAAAIPTFGDGLLAVLPTNRAAGPFRVDLTATRNWGTPQTWTDNTLRPTPPAPHHRSRR
jgi:hypothetical protein